MISPHSVLLLYYAWRVAGEGHTRARARRTLSRRKQSEEAHSSTALTSRRRERGAKAKGGAQARQGKHAPVHYRPTKPGEPLWLFQTC